MKPDPNFVRLMSVDVDYKAPPGHKLEPWTAGLHCPGCGQLGHFRLGVYFDHEMRCFYGCEPAPKWEPGVKYMKLVRDAKIVTIKPQNMTAEEFKQMADVYLQNVRRVVELCLKQDGDTSETSQRICVLNRLQALEHAINGVEDQDVVAAYE